MKRNTFYLLAVILFSFCTHTTIRADEPITKVIAYVICGDLDKAEKTLLPKYASEIEGDPVYVYLSEKYDVVVEELTNYTVGTIKDALAGYDAIVIREDVANSRNSVLGAIKHIDKPILNFQIYAIADNSRAFAIPGGGGNDGLANNGILKLNESAELDPEYAIFANIPQNNGCITVIDSEQVPGPSDGYPHGNKSIQGLQSFDFNLGCELAYGIKAGSINGFDNPIVSVCSIYPEQRNATIPISDTSKWLNIAFNRNAWYALNQNGYTLIGNAVAYLLGETITTSLSTPATNNEEIVKTRFLTMEGIECSVNHLANGTVYLKEVTFSSGKMKTSKLLFTRFTK